MPVSAADLFLIINNEAVGSTSCVVYVEKVHAGPKMSGPSAFKFGHNYGLIHMAVVAAGVRLEFVTAQRWQKHHGLILNKRGRGERQWGDTEKKQHLKARAQELYPGLKIINATADAILIADYGKAMQREGAAK